MMNLSSLRSFQNKTDFHSLSLFDQMMMNAAQSQQTANRNSKVNKK